jgi:hypothetical protein
VLCIQCVLPVQGGMWTAEDDKQSVVETCRSNKSILV